MNYCLRKQDLSAVTQILYVFVTASHLLDSAAEYIVVVTWRRRKVSAAATGAKRRRGGARKGKSTGRGLPSPMARPSFPEGRGSVFPRSLIGPPRLIQLNRY